MTDAIIHRGPDDLGIWTDPAKGIGLGFRRLSILDLSPDGHQPMTSASGRFVMVFNGEVYNFGELSRELAGLGHGFRGHSDTEVMLAAFEQWGVPASVPRFWGMFAFAVWDRQTGTLHLGRDRIGKKPLYYGWQGNAFLFGSELKALRRHPGFQGGIDLDVVGLFLRFNCVPGPHSIYQGIRKLTPGSVLSLTGCQPGVLPEPEPYWEARTMAERAMADPFRGTAEEAVDALDVLLRDAVDRRMVADVPVGAFLSGGIDSSLVVALMQAQRTTPVRTFSIGFEHAIYNEAAHAKVVANHLGTDHTEFYVRLQEAMDVIPQLPAMFDEPFSDSSQIPTYLVAKYTRQDVTVALSGDGGDELFGGYNRYVTGSRLMSAMGWLPGKVRAGMATGLRGFSPAAWDRTMRVLDPLVPRRYKNLVTGERVHKLADLISAQGMEGLYSRAVSHWLDRSEVLIHGAEAAHLVTDRSRWANLKDPIHQMMYLDLMTYLVDDVLVKVDRATMAVSLEGRAPLLDHRVAEFAWRLPLAMKIQGGKGKLPLRQLLDRYVPGDLVERPKRGFGIPFGDWLRGPLRDWAEQLLDPVRMGQQGILRPGPVQAKWRDHLSGAHSLDYDLWDVLMFQAWMEAESSWAAR